MDASWSVPPARTQELAASKQVLVSLTVWALPCWPIPVYTTEHYLPFGHREFGYSHYPTGGAWLSPTVPTGGFGYPHTRWRFGYPSKNGFWPKRAEVFWWRGGAPLAREPHRFLVANEGHKVSPIPDTHVPVLKSPPTGLFLHQVERIDVLDEGDLEHAC